MSWINIGEELPAESGPYDIMFTFSDKGEIIEDLITSYYHTVIKAFDIELDYLPQCRIIKWKKSTA